MSTILTRAHKELFQRAPDETFASIPDLIQHCLRQKLESQDRWHLPQTLRTSPRFDGMGLLAGSDGAFTLNDWSFSQLCKLAGVSKDTVNRVSSDTASRIFQETLPAGKKPLQIFTNGNEVRSIHGASYTRMFNTDLLAIVQEFAVDFQPPQRGFNSNTGLYCGEQDMFAFLIDPTGWTEIEGEAFAPGFFIWNSEVGRRSVGIETFWFQSVCANHIVWDAVEVVEFSRKHTANVHDALREVRRIIEKLVTRRDERRDGFARVMAKAMQTSLGYEVEEVTNLLMNKGINRSLAKLATEIAREQGRFTVFSLVDALTRLTGQMAWIGDRTETDQKVASLLALAV